MSHQKRRALLVIGHGSQLNADSATELAHHPDGRHVAIGTLTQRGMQPSAGIEFWDLVDGVRVARTTLTAAEIRSLDYSPDGSLLAAGEADAAAWGQLFIANPDLPERFARRAELNEPRPEWFYADGAEGYTDYPALGSGA